MMTLSEIRLKCLEMARPTGVSMPDLPIWVERARVLEAYVAGDTVAEPVREKRGPGRPRRVYPTDDRSAEGGPVT